MCGPHRNDVELAMSQKLYRCTAVNHIYTYKPLSNSHDGLPTSDFMDSVCMHAGDLYRCLPYSDSLAIASYFQFKEALFMMLYNTHINT